MNKKLLLIPIGIGLLLWILLSIFKSEDNVTGNKFEMSIPKVADDADNKDIKGVILLLDNSGSMKGYLDFAGLPDGKQAKASMIGTISNMFDRVHETYGIDPVCECASDTYNRSSFLCGMEDFSIFRGAVTELHDMIKKVAEQTSDSVVSIIASDMILSYGKKKLNVENDPFYNYHQLSQLGAQVHKAMEECKTRSLDIIILQYFSEFNGSYYYNYTENNINNIHAGKIMNDRPYYLMAIGSKRNLKSLLANHCFNRPEHIYTSFKLEDSDIIKQPFTLEKKDGNVGWFIGDPKGENREGSISTTTSFGDEESSLLLTCDRFEIPDYVSLNSDNKLELTWDETSIQNVRNVSVEGEPKLKFEVKLKPHSQLKNATTWIRLNSNSDWIDNAWTEDDTKDDIEGKTWGFQEIIKNIHDVYNHDTSVQPETIAEIKFKIVIQ